MSLGFIAELGNFKVEFPCEFLCVHFPPPYDGYYGFLLILNIDKAIGNAPLFMGFKKWKVFFKYRYSPLWSLVDIEISSMTYEEDKICLNEYAVPPL
ncbi:MAG: hypothetical protein LBU32_05940 [Clostridiales bacterium]|nr:hypothetical protein [Clostridiales bacterium]